MCIKGLGLSFVSGLSLWYWSRRFDRTLQVFIRPGIIRSGTKLSLLTETLTGTLVELRRLSTFRPHTAGLHQAGHYPLRDEVKFIDRDPHWYSRRVKEAIHVRLHPHNINRDRGFLKRGWLQSDNKTTDLFHSGPPRDQFLTLTMPTMLWIKTHQPWARLVLRQ